MEYYSAKKKKVNPAICTNTDLQGIMLNEVSQERNTNTVVTSLISHIYGILKNGKMILFIKQKLRHKCREQTYAYRVAKWGWGDELGDWD